MLRRFEDLDRPVTADQPLDLPLDLLLYIAPGAQPPYNLLEVIYGHRGLLGGVPWPQAAAVLRPHVWAPAWSAGDLAWFCAAAGAPPEELGGVMAFAPPGAGRQDIVHWYGPLDGAGGPAAALRVGGTRLLVLEQPGDTSGAEALAQEVVSGGGAAVLVVDAGEGVPPGGGALRAFMQELYAGIVHNRPLGETVENAERAGSAVLPLRDVLFIGGAGREDALRFDGLLERVAERAGSLGQVLEQRASALRNLLSHLHRAQRAVPSAPREVTEGSASGAAASPPGAPARGESTQIIAALVPAPPAITPLERFEVNLRTALNRHSRAENGLAQIRAYNFDQEIRGAVPLAQTKAVVQDLAADVASVEAVYAELEPELRARAAQAPRVLNANFADPQSRTLVPARQSLVAGHAYHLLVDVGPRWDKAPSIVRGSDAFPELALPPGEEGFVVRAVVVSSDFEPRSASAELWVPRGSGRSSPYADGKPAQACGPIALRLTAPEARQGEPGRVARARLCLYHENTLLQSALVSATVTRDASLPLETPNAVDVDFALSGTFQEVETRYAGRRVRFPWQEEDAVNAVGLNLTLNDGGAGDHRIIVVGDSGQPPVWVEYDPGDAATALENTRWELLKCFWERDRLGQTVNDGDGHPKAALNAKNGKSKQQLKRDVWALAQIGRQLHARISGRSQDPQQTAVQWEKHLRQGQILQIARTGPAQYTFPWALVYDYALPPERAAEWRYCRVLDEWSDAGERAGEARSRCPVEEAGEPHGEGILCPYGFWGLKHMIEQPLAGFDIGSDRLHDTPECFRPGTGPALAIGATSDPELDLRQLQQHTRRLTGGLGGGVHAVAPGRNPADTAAGVRALLADCEIAYFICHGEEGHGQPYIGVGLRDLDESHRIYATSINEWRSTSDPPNLKRWETAHPLVFINGCHTAELMPGSMLNFVNQFGKALASGVLGTEVSIRLPLAIEVAESLLQRVLGGVPVGQALYEVRWELANKGNLLGLAYTYYGLIGPGSPVPGGATPRTAAVTAEPAMAGG